MHSSTLSGTKPVKRLALLLYLFTIFFIIVVESMMVICFSVRLLLNKGKICRRFARYSLHSSPIMIKQQQVLPSKLLLNRTHMSSRRQKQQGTFDLQRRDVKLQIAGEEKENAHEDRDLPPSLPPSCYACTSPFLTPTPTPGRVS